MVKAKRGRPTKTDSFLRANTTKFLNNDGSVAKVGNEVLILPNYSGVEDWARKDGAGRTIFSAGSVIFADSNGLLAQDNSNFFWDDTNNRLGIGTATPDTKLEVEGSGSTRIFSVNRDDRVNGYFDMSFPSQMTTFDSLNDFIFTVQGSEVWRTDAGSLGVQIGYTDNLLSGDKLTVNGQVGIGTNTPDALLEVAGDTHINGNITGDQSITLGSNWQLNFGPSGVLNTAFEQDSIAVQFLMAVGDNSGNQFVMTNRTNIGSDHDHALQTNPTLFIHSDTDPDTANDEWISITHDVTDGVITTGSGAIRILSGGAIIGSGSSTHGVSGDGTLMVTSNLEVDGFSFFDNSFILAEDKLLIFGTNDSTGSRFVTSAGQDTFHLGLGTDYGNQLVVTASANLLKDHDHAQTTDPTLFIHSATDPDTANDEWISMTHDVTDGVITTGSGDLILAPAENVGIGTTTPDVKLEVIGEINLVINGGSIQGDETGAIHFKRTEGEEDRTRISSVWEGTDRDQQGLAFYTNASATPSVAPTEKVRIDMDGNVGIGTTTPDTTLQVVGDCKFGDDNTNYVTTSSTGLTKFVGTAGLPYGGMFTNSTIAVTISTSSTPTEIGDTWTTGEVNDVTFGASHYLVATTAGRYLINYSLSVAQNSPSAAIQCETGVMIDGVAQACGRTHRTIANSSDTGATAATCILDLAANEQVSLYVENETNTTNIDVEHGNLTIMHIGGT